jgi:phosphoglucosamine mutase
MFAKFLKGKGRLSENRVVCTPMSNMGLEKALAALGIAQVTAGVGDRYVLQEMLQTGAVLGGEPSGHMILLDCHTTGDGLLAALQLLEIMGESGQRLSELATVMEIFPQVIENVRVVDKPDLESLPAVMAAIESEKTRLGDQGRVLVRYSGTEPICRVMVEGPTDEACRRSCRSIAGEIRRQIGGADAGSDDALVF